MGGLGGAEAEKKATSLLERFKLADKAGAWPAELSGGQRQRVAIVQQLMGSNHVLLMDEPFSGLDPVMKDEACALLQEVASFDELITIIVITHDVHSAVKISDTVWLMGRDRNEAGDIIPGAKIQEEIDLKDNLAWRPNNDRLPAFARIVREIETRFLTL